MAKFRLVNLFALPELDYKVRPADELTRYNPFKYYDGLLVFLKTKDIKMPELYDKVYTQLPTINVASGYEAIDEGWAICNDTLPKPPPSTVYFMQADATYYKIIGPQHIGISFLQIGEDLGNPQYQLTERVSYAISSTPDVKAFVTFVQIVEPL